MPGNMSFKNFLARREIKERVKVIEKNLSNLIPVSLKNPTGVKAKQAKFEDINNNNNSETYCVFRTRQTRLLKWVIASYLFYNDFLSAEWSKKDENKKICIELQGEGEKSTDIKYKLTIFLTTGTIQVQGNNITSFNDDFDNLKMCTDTINLSTDEESDDDTRLIDLDDNTVIDIEVEVEGEKIVVEAIKQADINIREINGVETVDMKDITPTETMDKNATKLKEVFDNENTPTKLKEVIAIQPQNTSNEKQSQNKKMMKLQNESLEEDNQVTREDISKLNNKLNKLETTICDLMDKIKENNNINTSGNENNLCENEVRKLRAEKKERIAFVLEQGNKIKTLQCEIEHQRTLLSSKNREIEGLNETMSTKSNSILESEREIKSMKNKVKDQEMIEKKLTCKNEEIEALTEKLSEKTMLLLKKEDEIFDLTVQCKKLSDSDTAPFTQVKGKKQNTDSGNGETKPNEISIESRSSDTKDDRPKVKILGSSILAHVDPSRMYGFNTTMEQAYTIQQAKGKLENMKDKPDVIIYQVLSNDVKSESDDNIMESMEELVQLTETLKEDSKIILSLPPPRKDDAKWNVRQRALNARLEARYHDKSNVVCSSNENLGYNGHPNAKFYRDDVHINMQGTKILCANILNTLRNMFGLPHPRRNSNDRPNNWPNRYDQPRFNGRPTNYEQTRSRNNSFRSRKY
ncbi:unnamed protein product [Owenia fusiformis]|uniref:Uncharacterized protein n=1 Tax=Owenia fusiformis TaxID=6347 RepID=A0A8J1TM78_OWEFU|nr:unnamed protein product [Owenia fusiformis]